jgi:hypothetical protein
MSVLHNHKKIIVIVLLTVGSVRAYSILDDSLDSFLEFVVPQKEQEGFSSFYSQFLEKTSRKRKNSKKRYLRRLRFSAFEQLRKEKKDWYKEIEPYIFDLDDSTEQARKVRLFLTRFALLEDYHDYKKSEELTWIHTAKKYVQKAGHKLKGLKNRVLALRH